MSKQQLVLTKAASAKVDGFDNIDQHEMVAREAYLLAEKRGFNGGEQVQDWLEAEKKVNENLSY